MNLAKISGALSLVTLATFISPNASAGDPEGWYGGINIGESRARIDDAKIVSGLLGGGLATTSIADDNRDTGYKLYGGYQFNRYFALEAGYFDLGRFSFAATTVPPGMLNGSIRLRGVNFDAVGIVPITEKFSAFGRLGLNYAQARDAFSGNGAVLVLNPNPGKRDTNYKAGLGLQYAFTDSLAMRVEAERYRIDDAVGSKGDIDQVSVGLSYRFGAKAPAYVPPAATPVAYTPPVFASPPPVPPVPPAPPPAPRKLSLSADSLFDFDKAVLKPEGTQHLDRFAADLRGANFDLVTVTGHTDRIGSHEYNMKLSTRRAEAVKAHLVESAGIPAVKIVATGKDGADPVTRPGQCNGKKASQKLIACLQPDRRVDVEVSGTR